MVHLVVEIKWTAMGREGLEWIGRDGMGWERKGWDGGMGWRDGMVHLMVEVWLDRQDDHVALHHQLHVIHSEIHAPKSNKHRKNNTATGNGKRKYFFLESSVADPDPGSGAFLTPRSGIRDGGKICIRIRE
jgi:hypothetical protein